MTEHIMFVGKLLTIVIGFCCLTSLFSFFFEDFKPFVPYLDISFIIGTIYFNKNKIQQLLEYVENG